MGTQKYTREDRFAYTKNMVVNKVRDAISEINKGKESMASDYRYFFEWRSLDTYKMIEELEEYEALVNIYEQQDYTGVSDYLKHTCKHIADDILYGALKKQSTSVMANVAYQAQIEAKQNVYKFYGSLLAILNE